jgi:hypothetical protein
MRLEQREGRAVRLGSNHARVEVIRFPPPPALAAALRIDDRLERKAALPAKVGLGEDGVRLWRWRSAVADLLGDGPGVEGTALVRASGQAGVLAGFTLTDPFSTRAAPLATAVGWLDPGGRWTEESWIVTGRLIEAAGADLTGPAPTGAVQAALDRLASPIRSRLALTAGRRWTVPEPSAAARQLAARVGEWIALAARARDRRGLERLEQVLSFVVGGHTAGEAMLVVRMAHAAPADLRAWLRRVPAPTPRWDALSVRVTGIIVFEE